MVRVVRAALSPPLSFLLPRTLGPVDCAFSLLFFCFLSSFPPLPPKGRCLESVESITAACSDEGPDADHLASPPLPRPQRRRRRRQGRGQARGRRQRPRRW
ncbi:hypothetical protein psal_cds_1423 [Pandoravirus salinus]|uniref:Uncharacterized protein n=1 Tax=Pandoravirus salinus TaxID=1349410 RepID=A0A291ATV8_9VIRU|nr:hypothetical protein psal_cds_1423 [Pandoravirus salinus]ATE82323.1 hypothetical protein psal_cds_1423 [Pandoravirus salinus]